MRTVNVYEAKTRLSELLAAAEHGEETIVARNGKPIAKLVPIAPDRAPNRGFGIVRGTFEIPEDFDDPLPPEIQKYFE